MRFWRDRPAGLGVRLSAVLALISTYTAFAQDAPPINVGDADPLKECKRRDVSVFESDNKVYIYGGLSWVKNGTDRGDRAYQVLNHYLRVADFTSPRSLSDRTIMSIKDVPGDVTVFQYGAFWVDSKQVYIAGGQVMDEPWLSRDGKFLQTNYTSYTGDIIYNYDIEGDKWSWKSAVQPNEGSKVSDSFCCGSFAYNSARRKAYFYSGSTNDAGGRKLHPDAPLERISQKPVLSSTSLLVFDTATFKWTNSTLDKQTITTGTDASQFVYLPGTQSSGGGIGVLFGGRRQPTTDTMESMGEVLVYNSATDSWYKQTTTVEGGGNFPNGRMNFCAVAASAPDNSSHNIYMYGGESSQATPTAYSDLWILSVPSFRWMRVNVPSEARKSVTCTVVGQKYLMSYGGIRQGWGSEGNGDSCDDDTFGMRLFDMSSLTWTTQYDGPPAAGKKAYTVPKIVQSAIGGDDQGKATVTAPSRGFDAAALSTIFLKATSTSTSTSTSTATSTNNAAPTPESKKMNVGAIAGGVLGGLAVIILILIGVLLLLKRKKRQQKERAALEQVPLYHTPQQQQFYSTELPGHHHKTGYGAHEIYSAQANEPTELYAGEVAKQPAKAGEKPGYV